MSSRYPTNRRAFLCRAGAVATGFIAPLAFTRSVWAQGKADVIFSGGTIITMDTATPRAERAQFYDPVASAMAAGLPVSHPNLPCAESRSTPHTNARCLSGTACLRL